MKNTPAHKKMKKEQLLNGIFSNMVQIDVVLYESYTFAFMICNIVVEPPWYSSFCIAISSEFSRSSLFLYQENVGGGSPLHFICQIADRLTFTVLEPDAPGSMVGFTVK